jgi:uncharacterized protein YjiS (DUF1127 family)
MVTSLTADRSTQANIIIAETIGNEAKSLMELIATWRSRHATRQDLKRMSDHMLRDIGLTPGDAVTEIAKPFWRA